MCPKCGEEHVLPECPPTYTKDGDPILRQIPVEHEVDLPIAPGQEQWEQWFHDQIATINVCADAEWFRDRLRILRAEHHHCAWLDIARVARTICTENCGCIKCVAIANTEAWRRRTEELAHGK
jgi:hypothetical protein